jgi:ribosomal protein S18 acetylase RimI-like enzyme
MEDLTSAYHGVDLRPATGYSTQQLAGLWNRAYQGYFVDLTFDAEQMARHLAVHDIDLDRSIIMNSGEGSFIGMSLMGTRGVRGWVGGFGIDPDFRRKGFAYPLIAAQVSAAKAGAFGSLQLEVLTQNWASRVYDRAGFINVRYVEVLRGPLRETGAAGRVVRHSPEATAIDIQRLRCGGVWPWQRELATLLHTIGYGAEALAVETDGRCEAALIYRMERANLLLILDLAGEPRCVSALLNALAVQRAGCEAVLGNEPLDSELRPQLLEAGLVPLWTQREMSMQIGGV